MAIAFGSPEAAVTSTTLTLEVNWAWRRPPGQQRPPIGSTQRQPRKSPFGDKMRA